MPTDTMYGNNPYGLPDSLAPPGLGASATPPAAPERKVVRKVVRRRKGASRAASPAPTQTGSAVATTPSGKSVPAEPSSKREGRVDTIEGDSLSESSVQLLEMVLYYVSDAYPDRGEKVSDMIRRSASSRTVTNTHVATILDSAAHDSDGNALEISAVLWMEGNDVPASALLPKVIGKLVSVTGASPS